MCKNGGRKSERGRVDGLWDVIKMDARKTLTNVYRSEMSDHFSWKLD